MIKPIVKDIFFLGQTSEPATPDDKQAITDLLDTLAFHREGCVGLAANMIGVRKCIIVVSMGFVDMVMVNPVIIAKDSPYQTEEGCLSLPGERPTTRYENIEVKYQDQHFNEYIRKFSGWTAQIIQHEIDHCNGIII